MEIKYNWNHDIWFPGYQIPWIWYHGISNIIYYRITNWQDNVSLNSYIKIMVMPRQNQDYSVNFYCIFESPVWVFDTKETRYIKY
jgi:hypothetical protein